jgi:hypothetical protein
MIAYRNGGSFRFGSFRFFTLCHVICNILGIVVSVGLWYYDGSVDQTTYAKWEADILVHQPNIKAYKILKSKTLYDASTIAAPFGIFYGIVLAKWLNLSNVKRTLSLK